MLDLTESNPTRAGFTYPSVEILSGLADPRGLRYEPTPQGLLRAREAVAEHYAARGVAVTPERILLTASTSEAYAYLFKLLADPEDQILSPRPSYPLFEFLAALESVEVRQYPLRYDGAWHIDFHALEAAITARTRAIVVVNPNNPTGSFLKQEELARLDALAAGHGIALISDEVFADYGFGEDPRRVTTLTGDRQALTFSLSGLSKVAGLPQMKLGWMIASGADREGAIERLELIADTYLSVATPVQGAAEAMLASAGIVQEQIRERTAANLAFLRAQVPGSAANLLQVEGGWYATLQIPRTRSEEEWTLLLLRDHDVLIQPGFFFDFESEAYLVLSLLTEPPTFQAGVRRLCAII